jgi:hypothetical protein
MGRSPHERGGDASPYDTEEMRDAGEVEEERRRTMARRGEGAADRAEGEASLGSSLAPEKRPPPAFFPSQALSVGMAPLKPGSNPYTANKTAQS